MLERVIEEQNPHLLLNITDEECRSLGGCRYIITQLYDKVPPGRLEEVIRQKYRDDRATMLHMLGFLNTHIKAPG